MFKLRENVQYDLNIRICQTENKRKLEFWASDIFTRKSLGETRKYYIMELSEPLSELLPYWPIKWKVKSLIMYLGEGRCYQ